MSDMILIDGDQVVFLPMFSPAIVVVQPGKLTGSGPATIGGKNIAVEGDEAQVQVPGCTYMTPVYPIPGTGTLKIAQLAGDQKAQHCSTGGKKMLIKGSQFTAKFEVQSPAQQPTPGGPVPDATPQYSGQGMFVPSNVMKTAT